MFSNAPSGSGVSGHSRCRTSWPAWSCTSSCIARIRFVEESPTIAAELTAAELTAAERSALLALARCAIEAALRGSAAPKVPDLPAARLTRGAFVSLHEPAGDLRGCIGHVMGDRPLGEMIRRIAVSAARSDPRFAPVTIAELAELRIEISVLSELVALDPPDRCRLVIGRDGVVVRRERAQAVLLPQVATEQEFGAEAFLDAVCQK